MRATLFLSMLLLGCPDVARRAPASMPRPAEAQQAAPRSEVPASPSTPSSAPRLAVAGPPRVHALLAEQLDPAATARLEAHLAQLSKKSWQRVQTLRCAKSVDESGCVAFDSGDVAETLERFVAENLFMRSALGVVSSEDTLRRQVLDYEAFKLATFTATGVFPKRYFGYLDEANDTAAYETRLKAAARTAATVCNRWLEARGDAFRVTEQELIVTFLAEGGALLLREDQAHLESVHPVYGIGLDDIASGFTDLEPLLRALDEALGTKLVDVVAWKGGKPYLSRNFHFEEALAGTAAMWVWEKAIAERKLRAAGRLGLATRSPEQQFVIASLVYNSGILFDERTVAAVTKLNTGDYLFQLSERSKAKRWALPVRLPRDALVPLLEGESYPEQPTSWSAVYHVLQRYGAYAALSRCSDDFDAKGALSAK